MDTIMHCIFCGEILHEQEGGGHLKLSAEDQYQLAAVHHAVCRPKWTVRVARNPWRLARYAFLAGWGCCYLLWVIIDAII